MGEVSELDAIRQEIVDLKERRAQVWQKELPDDIADRPDAERMRLAQVANTSEKVAKVDEKIHALRAKERELAGE